MFSIQYGMSLSCWRLLLRAPRPMRAVQTAVSSRAGVSGRSGRDGGSRPGGGKRRDYEGGSSSRGSKYSDDKSSRRYDSPSYGGGKRDERNSSDSFSNSRYSSSDKGSSRYSSSDKGSSRYSSSDKGGSRGSNRAPARPPPVVVDNEDDWQDSGASYQDDEWQPSGDASPRGRYGSSGGGSSRYNSRDNDPRDQRDLYPTRPNPRDLLFGEVLYGVSPVLAALKHQRRTIHALYIQQSIDFSKRKDASSIKEAIQRAKELGAAVHETSKHDLNLLSNDRPHQGLVLDVSPLTWKSMDVFPTAAAAAAATAGRQPVWLALDEVVDPQNLGAVIRSAYCLGATGVLACSKNCAPLSAVVSKASAGVLEVIELHSCNSLPRTLLDAREKGWLVLGAAAGSSSKSCREVAVAQPTVLVVGSEGFGLRTNVRRACDQLVRVDMGISRRDSVVDSLNVSVATGILLHQLLGAAGGAAVVDDGGEDPASGDDEGEGEELE